MRFICGLSSSPGQKSENQDAALLISYDLAQYKYKQPHKLLLALLADGVSSCQNPKKASQLAVNFFEESLQQALALNSLQYAEDVQWCITTALEQTNTKLYFYDPYSRYPSLLTTLVGIVLFNNRLYVFGVGDSQAYCYRHGHLTLVTATDHQRGNKLALGAGKLKQASFPLREALGADISLKGYFHCLPALEGEFYCLLTDGVSDFIDPQELKILLKNTLTTKLNEIAQDIVLSASENGSPDNLTCLIIGIDTQNMQTGETQFKRIPGDIAIGSDLDGFIITDIIQENARSHIYKAINGQRECVIKVPSAYLAEDHEYLNRFFREEHIGLTVQHENLIRFLPKPQTSDYIYHLTQFINGKTLRSLLNEQKSISLELTYQLSTQIMLGLRCLHRHYYLHQDLKPENIMITENNVILIDLGSVGSYIFKGQSQYTPGTLDYAAPEYFNGTPVTIASDIFSLAVMSYEMLTGILPFSHSKIVQAKNQIMFKPPHEINSQLPTGLHDVFLRAFSLNPQSRYLSLSEFVADLNPEHFKNNIAKPLLESNPILFWKGLALILLIVNFILFYSITGNL